jgi:polysaccharide pyruvyl transferase WcaK-like protein
MLKGARRRAVDLVDTARMELMYRRWMRAAWQFDENSTNRVQHSATTYRALLVPSDPHTLVGARGDEAMIEALLSALLEHHPDSRISVLTATPEADSVARHLGLEPVRQWMTSPQTIARCLQDLSLDSVWVIGADVMDGSYDIRSTAFTLVLADIAARSGIATSVTGFSFGQDPDPRVQRFYEALSRSVRFVVRDQASAKRFAEFAARSATTAADIAFLLAPAPNPMKSAPELNWVRSQQETGRLTLVVNLHPMLLESSDTARNEELVRNAAEALSVILQTDRVSLLLLPHDHRGHLGDLVSLKPLAKALQVVHRDAVHLCETQLPAAEIKSLMRAVDATIAGRMHLVIASLGVGTPTAGITYQGKFEGLFELFGLPANLLIDPLELVAQPSSLIELINRLIEDRSEIGGAVRRALPTVLEAAQLNLAALDPR